MNFWEGFEKRARLLGRFSTGRSHFHLPSLVGMGKKTADKSMKKTGARITVGKGVPLLAGGRPTISLKPPTKPAVGMFSRGGSPRTHGAIGHGGSVGGHGAPGTQVP